MKYFRNFLIAAFMVFIAVALGNNALAKHTPDTSGAWLVTIDWDRAGNPSIVTKPVRFDTPIQCSSASSVQSGYLRSFEPDRLYISVCAYPDDSTDLDEIIDMVIEDFSPYFNPGQGV